MDLKLSPRDQLIAAGMLIAVATALLVFFVIVPEFRQLGVMTQQMNKAESDITAARQLLSARQEAKSAAAETQARLTRLDNEIPDAPELAALIIDLQNTANDAGVSWDKLTPAKPGSGQDSKAAAQQTTDGFQKIGVTFSVTGRWDDIVDYARRLAELERAVRIKSVDVAPENGTAAASTPATLTAGEEQKLAASFDIEVYSLPRPGTTSSGAPGAPQ